MKFWPGFGFRKAGREKPAPGAILQILIVCDGSDSAGMSVADNLLPVLEFAKLRYSLLDLDLRSAWPPLDGFASVVVATDCLDSLNADRALSLRNYVLAGGGLLVACRSWHVELADLFGIARSTKPATALWEGLEFVAEFYPGISGLKMGNADWQFSHDAYALCQSDLAADCAVLATSSGGNPLAWHHRFGDGKTVFWNTNELSGRSQRGFLLQTLLMTMKFGISAVGGFAMFQIDDYPPALSDVKKEPVNSEYGGIDCTSFFFDIWYEDMMALRQRHNLKYSWYVVMDYDDLDTGEILDENSDEFRERARIRALRFTHLERQAEGDEYGFHGYNHVPLTSDLWPDPAILEGKLKLARRLWEEGVPAPLPASWVPTNNWYHPRELAILSRTFPEIEAVCSTYSNGQFGMGEFRDFGREPWESSLLCLPRETYGYVLDAEMRMLMLSQIASLGMWTHFIHPDDVYDMPSSADAQQYLRNPQRRNWKKANAAGLAGMFEMLDRWLGRVRAHFPWIEFLTAREATARYRDHMANEVKTTLHGDGVEIESERDCMFCVRVDEQTGLEFDGDAVVLDAKQVREGRLFFVKLPAGCSRIRAKRTTA